MLLLFLTTSEFGSNNSNGQGTPVSLGKDGNPINKLKDEVREKVGSSAAVAYVYRKLRAGLGLHGRRYICAEGKQQSRAHMWFPTSWSDDLRMQGTS